MTLCTVVFGGESGETVCDVADDTCWASYARLATNKVRRQAGVPSIGAGPDSAASDAHKLATELAQSGSVYTRNDAVSGCGWSTRAELVAAVQPQGNIAQACVDTWVNNDDTRADLLDAEAETAVYAHVQSQNGTVFCVQTYIDVDRDANCSSNADVLQEVGEEEWDGTLQSAEQDLESDREGPGFHADDDQSVTSETDENGRKCYKICLDN